MKSTQFKKLFYQLSKKEQRELKELVAGSTATDQVERGGEKFEGFNKPKRTPNHPTKSHAVLAKEGDQVKLIRFGEQGAKTAGKPKEGESEAMKKKRAAFKARHAENIKKGKMSAAYWANKVKW